MLGDNQSKKQADRQVDRLKLMRRQLNASMAWQSPAGGSDYFSRTSLEPKSPSRAPPSVPQARSSFHLELSARSCARTTCPGHFVELIPLLVLLALLASLLALLLVSLA